MIAYVMIHGAGKTVISLCETGEVIAYVMIHGAGKTAISLCETGEMIAYVMISSGSLCRLSARVSDIGRPTCESR